MANGTRILKCLALVASALVSVGAASGDIDFSFDPGSGIDGYIYALAVQPNGKIVIGGDFTSVKGVARNGIARLNPDGTTDLSFNPSLNRISVYEPVDSIALEPDGKILIGGGFIYEGVTGCVARLNADGSVDREFARPVPAGYDIIPVRCIARQADGKVVIGGTFTRINDYERNRLARLNTDGTIDTSFKPNGSQASVYSLQSLNNGDILIGGVFFVTNGGKAGLARFASDGTSIASFLPPGLTYLWPDAGMVVQPDDKIIVTVWNDLAKETKLVRLNSNGSMDSSFTQSGTNQSITASAVQSDGRILVTQGLTLARLNSDGSPDHEFLPVTVDKSISHIALQGDGSALIAGGFQNVEGLRRVHLARLRPDGGLDKGFDSGSGVPGPVSVAAVQSDGKVLIADGRDYSGRELFLSRLNRDGTVDSSFQTQFSTNALIYSITPEADGQVLLTGRDLTAPLLRINGDGSLDPRFQLAVSNVSIWSVALQSDRKILIGAAYNFPSSATYSVLRLNTDGSLDNSFQPVTNAWDMVLQADGKILLRGEFYDPKLGRNRKIVRVHPNGHLDQSFDFTTEFWSTPSPFGLQPDGKVMVVGEVREFSSRRTFVARLQPDGSYDGTFNNIIVENVLGGRAVLQPDGKILVGLSSPGWSSRFVRRFNIDGTLDESFLVDLGQDVQETRAVYTIIPQPNGEAVVAGKFATVNGVGRWSVARIFTEDSTPNLKLFVREKEIFLSWPTNPPGFHLEYTPELQKASWTPNSATPSLTDGQFQIRISTSEPSSFFRLTRPR